MNGFRIVLEGPDGSGKGTQSEILCDRLWRKLRNKRDVLLTHEPWEMGQRGSLIRDVLEGRVSELPQGSGSVNQAYFQWQFAYNRACEHWPQVVLPALSRGAILISDRSEVSTYAYGNAFGVPVEMIHDWHKLILPSGPDLVIYLETQAETCLRRMTSSGRNFEFFDRRDQVSKVISSYHVILERYFADVTVCVNNELPIEETSMLIYEATCQKLGLGL
jgi:dTMP kinase